MKRVLCKKNPDPRRRTLRLDLGQDIIIAMTKQGQHLDQCWVKFSQRGSRFDGHHGAMKRRTFGGYLSIVVDRHSTN